MGILKMGTQIALSFYLVYFFLYLRSCCSHWVLGHKAVKNHFRCDKSLKFPALVGIVVK